jgi:cyclopropane-fatty-acyl-phospholipid synthase
LVLYIVRHIPKVQIGTITLSENQRVCACGSSALGLQRSHPVHVLDYREMSHEQDGSFDRVVSIKMVEAVGLENVDVHWAAIDRVLKRKNAAGKEHVVCDSTVSPLHRTFFPPTSCVLL